MPGGIGDWIVARLHLLVAAEQDLLGLDMVEGNHQLSLVALDSS
jgi:hypothetical protein